MRPTNLSRRAAVDAPKTVDAVIGLIEGGARCSELETAPVYAWPCAGFAVCGRLPSSRQSLSST